MKTERRHELHTNELADWMVHFPTWAKENRNNIIYIAIVIIVCGALWYYKYGRVAARSVGEQQITNLIDTVERHKMMVVNKQVEGLSISDGFVAAHNNLGSHAALSKNNIAAAIALVKAADALRADMHYRPEIPPQDVLEEQVNKAKNLYEQALQKAPENAQLAAMANLGIGLSLEELGQFGQAKDVYQKIVSDEKYAGIAAAWQARLRMATLDDNKQQVYFAQASKPRSAKPDAAGAFFDEQSTAQQKITVTPEQLKGAIEADKKQRSLELEEISDPNQLGK